MRFDLPICAVEAAGALLVYALLTAALFGPVLGHFTTWLYGVIGDGPMTPATIAQRLTAARQGGLFGPLPSLLGQPFPSYDPGAVANPLWWYTAVLLAMPLGPIGATNAMVFMSFVLTAFATFLLLRRFTVPPGAALVGGLIYGFCPAHIAQAQEHALLLDQYWYVLVGWLLIAYTTRPGQRWAGGLGVTLALTELDNPYLGYFAALLAGAWYLGLLIGRLRALDRRPLVSLLAHGGFALLILIGIVVPTQVRPLPALLGVPQPAASGPPVRALGDLESLSLRWWDLLLPFPANPLEGSAGRRAFNDHLGGSNATEASVMAGTLALLFAVGGAVVLIRERRSARRKGGMSPATTLPGPLQRLAVTSIAVGVVAGLPPTFPFGPWSAPTPTLALYAVAPEIRSLARADGLIQLGIAILAAYGAARLAACRPGRVWRSAVIGALIVGIAGEYTDAPPWRYVALLPAPGVDAWLAHVPDAITGIVAVYPLQLVDAEGNNLTGVEAFDAYAIHHHRLFNGTAPVGLADALRRSLSDLANPTTASTWAALGVRTIVVPGDVSPTPPGMVREYHDGTNTAFAVTAAPLPLLVGMSDGFGAASSDTNGRQWRWVGASARIAVDNVGAQPVTTVLWMRVHNNGGAHTVTMGTSPPEPVSAASAASPVALANQAAPGLQWLSLMVGGPATPERGSADPTPVSVEVRSLEPALVEPLRATFLEAGQPRWTLTGASADACRVTAGDTVDVALLWRVTAPTRSDETIFVHLVAAAGSLVTQADAPPDGGLAPTAQEPAGTTVVDVHRLQLPATLPAGAYQIHVGLYARSTGRRLALAGGGNTADAGSLIVTPASAPRASLDCFRQPALLSPQRVSGSA